MVSMIAVGTDGSETAGRAVDFAIDMAERYRSKLLIASSFHPVSEDRLAKEKSSAPAEIQWSINPMEDVEATLREAEDKARERGVETLAEARQGDPADVLCAVASEHDVDILVVGTKGMHRRVLGSVPNTITHKAQCSVMLVKTG